MPDSRKSEREKNRGRGGVREHRQERDPDVDEYSDVIRNPGIRKPDAMEYLEH